MDGQGLGMGVVAGGDKPTEKSGKSPKVSVKASKRGKIGDDQRPICKIHYCLMVANGSQSKVTSYKCPVPGCDQVAKVARPIAPAPREPHWCPRCANGPNQDGKGKRVALVVDQKAVRFNVRLICPTVGCGHSVEIPRGREIPQVDPEKNPA